ncbi:hypothetical protein QQX98_006681 [Neonectria punicea]|uniref:Uncharacterized protein n=1 Tax=Neonectria punicea TaxID=979145 RepID=A0ABR1H065_9HYPO
MKIPATLSEPRPVAARPGSPASLPVRQHSLKQLTSRITKTYIQATLQLPKPSLEPEAEPPEQVSPSTQKQQIADSGRGGDSEHQLERAQLTQKNLSRLDNMMKKGITEASESDEPDSTPNPPTPKTVSTTMSVFEMCALKNGILDPSVSEPPRNLKQICKRHAQRRASVSYSEPAYKQYLDQALNAPNEDTMIYQVGPKLLKEPPIGYQTVLNQPFTGFPKEVGFNNGLSAPQPDFAEGVRVKDYRPFPVDEFIHGAVLHKNDISSITLPHFAGEWKGRGKNMEEARLQSSYDGAALVYARNQALSYLGKSDPPGHAEITTFATDGRLVDHYAHYAAVTEDGSLEYHQYLYANTDLRKSRQDFNDGRRGLRNAQDYARKQSYALRDQLKIHWKQQGGGRHPVASAPAKTTPNAEDEEEGQCEVVEQPCQPAPPASKVPARGGGKRKASPSRKSPRNHDQKKRQEN